MRTALPLIATLCLATLSSCNQALDTSGYSRSEISKVIVDDDNSRVEDRSPMGKLRQVGQIQMSYLNKGVVDTYNCTGTLIASNIVITSAHCVYNAEEGYPYEVVFIPGAHIDGRSKYSREFVEKIYINSEYVDLEDTQDPYSNSAGYDFALLKLRNSGGRDISKKNTMGWYSYWYLKDKYLSKRADVRIASYPGDKNDGSLWKQDDCVMEPVTEYLYKHTCDTMPGSSGAALVGKHPYWSTPEKMGKDTEFVYAIHHGGSNNRNFATRITPDRQKRIREIIAGDFSKTETMFTEVELLPRVYKSINIINDCHNDVQIGLSYEDQDFVWQNVGMYNLAPGEGLIDFARTGTSHFFLRALDIPRRKHISRRDGYSRNFHGSSFDMQKVSIDQGLKDYYHRITCD